MMIQYIIVGIIILLAIIFVARRIYLTFTRPDKCSTGCTGCKLWETCNKKSSES
ncbi:MAG: FeoB-associated Cys-rich membrane protein [Prevotella sp.]|nr:FeoB-associated Cys-rich membrane protein [Prevotella sp.]MDE6150640.1 FeoB-associated Cys-rich membrane protein [Prevotella sp.]